MKPSIKRAAIYAAWIAVAGLALPLIGDEKSAAPAIRLTGCRIKPADQVTLSANQSGVLELVPREGDPVEVGQRVISLQDELARATVAVAQKEASNDVDIRVAIAVSEVERLEHEQNLEINQQAKGTISLADVRRAKLEYDRSLLQIEQARHKQAIAVLKRYEAAAQLKTYHVNSPIAATVSKVIRHKGETVRQGDPVLELVNTRQVRVEGFLDATLRRQVKPGTAVQIQPEPGSGSSAAAPIAGRIVFVDSVVQPVTQQVRVCADVDNVDELLVPGLTAIMTISPASRPDAVTRR